MKIVNEELTGHPLLLLLDQYSQGTFHLELPSVSVYIGDKPYTTCKATIKSTTEGDLEILLDTGLRLQDVQKAFLADRPYSYIRDELKLRIESEWNGFTISSGPLTLDNFVIIGAGSQALSFRQLQIGTLPGSVSKIVSWVEYDGKPLRITEFFQRDNYIEENRRNLPETLFSIPLVNARAHFQSRNSIDFITFTLDQPASHEDTRCYFDNLCVAVGFAVAHRVHPAAYLLCGKDNEYCLNLSFKVIKGYREFYQPIWPHPNNTDSAYQLVAALYTSLQSRPNADAIKAALESFWLAAFVPNNYTQALIIAPLIEGLADVLTDRDDKEERTLTKAKSIILELIAPLSGESVQSLRNMITNAKSRSLKRLIVALRDQMQLPVHNKEIRTFVDVRNRVAHGTLRHPYQEDLTLAQKELDEVALLAALFNKIIIGFSGYRSYYTNYGKPGCPVEVFSGG